MEIEHRLIVLRAKRSGAHVGYDSGTGTLLFAVKSTLVLDLYLYLDY
jgi:hypothetical protein